MDVVSVQMVIIGQIPNVGQVQMAFLWNGHYQSVSKCRPCHNGIIEVACKDHFVKCVERHFDVSKKENKNNYVQPRILVIVEMFALSLIGMHIA